MLKCVKITSFFFVLLFELLPDTKSTVSGDCDFLRSCVNYKYREKKKKKKEISLPIFVSDTKFLCFIIFHFFPSNQHFALRLWPYFC